MAGVAFAVEGDGVGFATESYAASALCATLASLSVALWRIRRAKIAVPKFPLPKGPPIIDKSPVHVNEPLLTYGARESCNTTATFIIHPGRGVDDLLMIGIDEHNGE